MSSLTGAEFVRAVAARRSDKSRLGEQATAGVRFAFYGRMSTSDCQDPVSSRAWQRGVADELVEDHGEVVVEFFDEGRSRRWSWAERPAAAALLVAAEASVRQFDAVVVGEYERAFYGDQFRDVVARLDAVGVQVWLPEAGGPVELDSPVHQALLVLLGAQAQREVVRARHRVLAAMSVQTRVQGRFLGGRPPYGYRLVDGGPHPNAIQARWGRRVQVLEPDPATAGWVRWMFTERARGRSVASLVRELNERGVPCPSRMDRARNSHRPGSGWIVRTVQSILENPRYTGRQVWNRQCSKGHGEGGRVGGRGSGAVSWNRPGKWEVSECLVHAPLVDDATFVAVQRIRAARDTKDGQTRQYVLAGLVVCGVCGRRMDAHWVHGRAGYRCRHGRSSGTRRPDAPVPYLYVREDHLLELLPGLLDHEGPALGDSPSTVRHLREHEWEIVCGHDRREVRPVPLRRRISPVHEPGQLSLEPACEAPPAGKGARSTASLDQPRSVDGPLR